MATRSLAFARRLVSCVFWATIVVDTVEVPPNTIAPAWRPAKLPAIVSMLAGRGAGAAVNPRLVAGLAATVPLPSVNWPANTGIPPAELLELDPEAAFVVVPRLTVVVALPAVLVALPAVLPAELAAELPVVAPPPKDAAELLGGAEAARFTVPPTLEIAPPACAKVPGNDGPPIVKMPAATKVPWRLPT